MIEDPNKPDTLEATARDYLGQPSPLAFKNQPALPSGGGSIGVGAGPSTTAAGTGVSGVKRDAAFQRVLDSLAPDPTAGGSADASGEGSLGDPGAAGITGFDSTTAGIGLNAAALALGLPGAVGAVSGLATGVPAATGVPSVASAVPSLGKLANNIMGPHSDLTLNSTEGPITVNPAYTGFFDALMNAIGGKPNFTVVNARGETVAAPPSATQGFTEGGPHPAFGFQGFNAPGQTPNPEGNINILGTPRSDAPPDAQAPPSDIQSDVEGTAGPGGSGGGGGTFLCTALHKRGLMDDATLDANHRFARTMTLAEHVGYARWARPLVAWGDRHPRAALALYAVMGWAPRAYMAEIRTPGSSLVGRVLLAVGLRVCAMLGRKRLAVRAESNGPRLASGCNHVCEPSRGFPLPRTRRTLTACAVTSHGHDSTAVA